MMKRFSLMEKPEDDKTQAEYEIERKMKFYRIEYNLKISLWLIGGFAGIILSIVLLNVAGVVIGLAAVALGFFLIPVKKKTLARYQQQLEELKALRQQAELASTARFEEKTKK